MIASLLLLLPVLAEPEIVVRAGAPVTLDGKCDSAEWEDAFAATADLAGGKSLRLLLKRTGPWLAVGIDCDREYRGDVVRVYVCDAAASWVALALLGIGQAHYPPVLWRRGPPDLLDRRPPEFPRACRAVVRVAEEGRWSAEYLVGLSILGIGRGDRREFRGLVAVGNESQGAVLVLPKNAPVSLAASTYARLSSPDGWGASERWPPPDPAHSREYDDYELLHRLYLEHEKISLHEEPTQFVISDAVHERSVTRIQALRTRLEAGMARNPSLPAWKYFLGRLLHEGNFFEDARSLIESVPAPLRRLDAFVTLAAEHYFDTQQWDKALEVCARYPTARGVEENLKFATAGKKAWEEEVAARAADEAKPEKNPRVRIETDKGAIECELFEDDAPNAVRNFVDLVLRERYYDRLRFHGVVGGVAARVGDPRTRPGGGGALDGPEWKLRADGSRRRLLRGALAVIPAEGGGLHGSQFAFAIAPLLREEKTLEVFGRVLGGQEVVDALEQDDRLISIELVQRRNHGYDARTARVR
ncbi:MAG: peptidylprolyl isomerase [Planctomycetota bacterium]